jgi:hypothetical protein
MLSALRLHQSRLKQMKRRALFFNFDGHPAHRRFVAMGCCDRLRRIVRRVGTMAAAIARQTPTTK